jgi:hypothetical protein
MLLKYKWLLKRKILESNNFGTFYKENSLITESNLQATKMLMPFFLQLIFPFVPQKSSILFIYLFIFGAKVKHGILASKDFQNQLILIRLWLKKQTLNTPLCIWCFLQNPPQVPCPPQRKKRKEKETQRHRYLPIYIYTQVGRVFNLFITV